MPRIAALVLACLAVFVAGCGTLGAPPVPEVRRANPVTLRDPADGRELLLRIAYPAGGQQLPIVLFSHGAYSSKDLYDPIVDAWAARGYIVISPTHRDSVALGVRRGTSEPRYFTWRLDDMALILAHLDTVLAQAAGLAERADPQTIVAAGHSFGGLVAQTLGGATYGDAASGATLSRADPRVRAVIIFSGAGVFAPVLRAADFSTLRVPTLVTVGTNDLQQVPGLSGQDWRKQPFDLAPAGSKYRLTLDGADHYLGGMVGRDDLPRDPRGPAWLAAFIATSATFLDAYASGRAAARHKLEQQAAAPPVAAAPSTGARLEMK
jgi:dienelactone hydrolase